MLIAMYKNIQENTQQQRFSMPTSLRYMKELAKVGLDWRGVHLIDLTSIIYSLRIDDLNRYLERRRHEQLAKRGIQDMRQATETDFNAL